MRTTLDSNFTSGSRSSWYKKVTSVDITQKNGYAFDGDFIKPSIEVELNEGDVLIEKRPQGSVKHGYHTAHIYKVENDELKEIAEFEWFKEFLSFRDKVAELLSEPVNPLANFSDDELIAEIKRRNLSL